MMNISNTYNSAKIEYIMNYPSNTIHSIILSCWPNMVNCILSIIEMAIDSEGKQYSRVKKNLNTIIYRSRNNSLIYFDSNEFDKKDILNFFYNEFSKMQDDIENILNITFSNERQRNFISQAIVEIEKGVLNGIIQLVDKEYD